MLILPTGLPRRIALVGCGGFVGSHLLQRLLQLGVEVEGWDLEDRRIESELSNPQFTFHQCDYATPPELAAIASHAVVIHLAALCNPSLYNTEDQRVIHSNFTQPARLADACAQSGAWLIYCSTSEVYGRTVSAVARELGHSQLGELAEEGDDMLHEDLTPLVLGPIGARRWSYACAKQLLERYLIALDSSAEPNWTVIRPFNFLGPAMDFIPGVDGEGIPRVMACFMDALLHGRPLDLVDGGKAKRCFTWIGDAVEAFLVILRNSKAVRGQAINIGNPANETDVRTLAHDMARIYAQHTHALLTPSFREVSGEEFYGKGYQDSDRRMPDIGKLQRLGWQPQTGLVDTLEYTIAWFVRHYAQESKR